MHRFCLCAVLALAACGGSAGARGSGTARPAWIDHPPQIPGLVLAAAQGPERSVAQDRAKQEVMAQIQVSVASQRTQSSQATETISSNGERSQRWMQQMEEQATLKTKIDHIPGLRIREEWRGPDGVHHALAELDRSAWAATVRAELNDCDLRLDAAYQVYRQEETAAPENESPLSAALRLHRQLIPLMVERREIVKRLRLADPQGGTIQPPCDLSELESRLAQLLAQITIALQPTAEAQALAPELTQRLALAGMPLLNDPSQAIVRIDVDLHTEVQHIEGQMRVDGLLEGSLLDVRSQRRVAGLRLRDRASGTNEAIARSRLYERLGQALAKKLDEAILEALTASDG